MKDLYAILGTDVNCTAPEIREAYRKLSKKFHPDLNPGDAYFEGRHREVCEAYETLGNPQLRKQYDLKLQKAKPQALIGAPVKRFRATTYINIVFTITLMGLTGIFANYVMRVVGEHKKVAVKGVAVAGAVAGKRVAVAVVKRKRNNKVAVAGTSEKVAAVEEVKEPVGPAVIARVRNVAVVPVVKKGPAVMVLDSAKANSNKLGFLPKKPGLLLNNTELLTAIVRGNVTGVVYMRRADNYQSDVVGSIPNNSKVTVLERGKTFCKVQFEGKVGYVPGWTVSPL